MSRAVRSERVEAVVRAALRAGATPRRVVVDDRNGQVVIEIAAPDDPQRTFDSIDFKAAPGALP